MLMPFEMLGLVQLTVAVGGKYFWHNWKVSSDLSGHWGIPSHSSDGKMQISGLFLHGRLPPPRSHSENCLLERKEENVLKYFALVFWRLIDNYHVGLASWYTRPDNTRVFSRFSLPDIRRIFRPITIQKIFNLNKPFRIIFPRKKEQL